MKNVKLIEMIYKRFRYILPEESTIYLNGKKLVCYSEGRVIKKLTDYQDNTTSSKYFKIGLPISGLGSTVYLEYHKLYEYLNNIKKLTYQKFDYLTNHEMILCTFFKSKDSKMEENAIEVINKTLPFILNIFRRPLIHLKETNVVNQVDNVKRINHTTIRHLGMHPENINDIQNKVVRPSKLLTRIYVDDFGIYENIVFKDLIDMICGFLEKRMYSLSEVINNYNQSVRLDDVSNYNHPKYFLAVGKLYLGFSSKEDTLVACKKLDNTESLYRVITKNKSKDVYSKNKDKKPIKGEVRQTNILLLHKDYKHIYTLYKKFIKLDFEDNDGSIEEQNKSQLYYTKFVNMITLFSIANFNFYCKETDIIYDDGKMNTNFSFLNWKLLIVNEFIDVLGFEVIFLTITKNRKKYKIILIPMTYYISIHKKDTYEYIIKKLIDNKIVADKYVFLEPFTFEYKNIFDYSIKHPTEDVLYGIIPVSISEVNSFRRIQKIILEGLTNVNTFDYCSFCGNKITVLEEGSYFCNRCLTIVEEVNCSCGHTFKGSKLKVNPRTKKDTNLSYFYRLEKLYSFRNITNMINNNYQCPNCGAEVRKKV